jgi:hypothetical protein
MNKLQPIKYQEHLLLFCWEFVIFTSAILKHAYWNIQYWNVYSRLCGYKERSTTKISQQADSGNADSNIYI